MNDFQLDALKTEDLIVLRSSVERVLARRRRRERVKAISTEEFDSLKSLNAEITRRNSSSFLFPVGIRKKKVQNLVSYLPALLAQDWYHLYPPTGSLGEFYVYAHVDPRKPIFVADRESGGNYGGMPFYIGKGTGDRAFDLKRNQGHGKLLAQLLGAGYHQDEIVKVLVANLLEHKAFEMEAKLIYFFGTIYQKQETGPGKGCLLNLDTPKIPDFAGPMEEVVSRSAWKQRYSEPTAPRTAEPSGAVLPAAAPATVTCVNVGVR